MPGMSLVTVPEPVMESVSVTDVNVAVTVLAALISTVHVEALAGVQPVHRVNTAPCAGAAVSVTRALGGKPAEHVGPEGPAEPQSMALPTPVTVPVPPPTPAIVTFSGLLMNVAVTVRVEAISTVHVLPFADVHPVQAVNAEPGFVLLACRCTVVPGGNFCVHVAPQSMTAPGSVPTTVPVPVPARATVSVTLVKVAVMVRGDAEEVISTVQVLPLTELQPVQLPNAESAVGVAVSVSVVPVALLDTHVLPQLIGTLVPVAGVATPVTVPVPVPARATVRRAVVKFAVMTRFEFIVTRQVLPSTLVQPLQLANVEP